MQSEVPKCKYAMQAQSSQHQYHSNDTDVEKKVDHKGSYHKESDHKDSEKPKPDVKKN